MRLNDLWNAFVEKSPKEHYLIGVIVGIAILVLIILAVAWNAL